MYIYFNLKNLSSRGFRKWLSQNDESFKYTTFEKSNVKIKNFRKKYRFILE